MKPYFGAPCQWLNLYITLSTRTTQQLVRPSRFSAVLAKGAVFRAQRFRPKTAEEWLDLTSYMSYTDADGRGLPYRTALIIRTAHIAR